MIKQNLSIVFVLKQIHSYAGLSRRKHHWNVHVSEHAYVTLWAIQYHFLYEVVQYHYRRKKTVFMLCWFIGGIWVGHCGKHDAWQKNIFGLSWINKVNVLILIVPIVCTDFCLTVTWMVGPYWAHQNIGSCFMLKVHWCNLLFISTLYSISSLGFRQASPETPGS